VQLFLIDLAANALYGLGIRLARGFVMAIDVVKTAAAPEPLWRAPLVPVALAATAGILLDRWSHLPLLFTLGTALLVTLCGLILAWRHRSLSALVLMWCGVAALSAAYHHWQHDVYPADDIGRLATEEPRAVLLRGVVDTQPLLVKHGTDNDLRSFPSRDGGRFVLQVTHVKQAADWEPVSGRVQVHTARPTVDLHVGDEVEVAGRMHSPALPANPGEFDQAAVLADQRIRAVLTLKDSDDSVTVLERGGFSVGGALAWLRGRGQDILMNYLPAERQGLAIALLLGDGAPMTQEDWEKYIRTGVIHVLAISGQHLVILAGFLGVVLRLLGVRLRYAVVIIMVLLLTYALLVGGRPPVMRSVVTVAAVCGGLFVRRPLVRANTFALSWLVVALLNPTDLFTAGCQLSFLSVAVLTWGTRGWWTTDPDSLAQLVAESRPAWHNAGLWVLRQAAVSYAITLGIWVVVAPLVAARMNIISPVGLLIGPPVVLLTSIALLAGFALLLLGVICPPLAPLAAWVTDRSLAGCDWLVTWGTAAPGGCWYVPAIPAWWLWIFYAAVLGLLTLPTLRRVWGWCAIALLMLLTVGLVGGAAQPRSDELRCTFLAVGHGGCIVLETPDGRTMLYDVGSLRGPEVVRRQVAPYLWHRGIRRIDEVFLSHADLDHFNGLTALVDRFAVGQVSCTPTFQERQTAAVRRTVREVQTRGVPVRVLTAGQALSLGEIRVEVLHPPPFGPTGNENARSLVLLIRHAGHSILLTGDLEGPGLEMVLKQSAPRVHVLMAPHHGNLAATEPLVAWAQPKVIVSCQAAPKGFKIKDANLPQSSLYLGTWPHGAVTVRSRAEALIVETYISRQRWRLE
jgi:competence protein ComEC